MSDEELMARYAKGHEQAFELLFSRYYRPMFSFLYRYLGHFDKAEDVLQEVFYEVIRARKRYRPKYKFASWFFRIGRNRAVDRLRRNGLRQMQSLDKPLNPRKQESESQLAMVPAETPNPEGVAQGLELEEAVTAALASLPPEQSEVFWLKEKSGLTLAEIADLTGVSDNTVKSRLRYALEKIRAHLSQQGFTP
jgi:RNA polymerase sigma-70 factor (ECF subfamily)